MSSRCLPRLMALWAAVFVALQAAPGAAAPPEQGGPAADGWVTHPEVTSADRPVVLHFRREIRVDRIPATFPVAVSADNRFVLSVNGRRVAAGPSVGTTANWRQTLIDLAAYLHSGRNVISAVVWNAVKPPTLVPAEATAQERAALARADRRRQTAPFFQQSIATGFRMAGTGLAAPYSTGLPGWTVKIDQGRRFANGMSQGVPGWYIAGAPETIDGTKAVWDAGAATPAAQGWTDAVAATDAMRHLVTDTLLAQRYSLVNPDRVLRSDLKGAEVFPRRPVTIPAHRTVKILMGRNDMVAAYPSLDVAGGRGSTIKATYAEALYDANGIKGDRNLVGNRTPKGIYDIYIPDGGARRFSPLWWRTWRYIELEITTADAPLRLENWRAFETGYPFAQVGRFVSSDPELNRIWDIGWRTARIDAHETYMDSAYWEQLQYVGDTRLQMLISYAVSGDTRLAEQAIDAFAESDIENGLVEGAYPSRTSNVIATFSLLWIGMLDDWRMTQPDTGPITRNIPRMRRILEWFRPWLSPRGLLTKNPQWNFIDWVGQNADDRTVFPSYSQTTGETCLMSAHYLGALQQSALIEASSGSQAIAHEDLLLADRVAAAIRNHCWSSSRQLFADSPDGQVFSQQMNALAVLYNVVPKVEAPALLDRIVEPGKGIDAPEGMFSSSYYFAWYLVRAFEHAGRGDRYVDLLKTWRDLLALNFTAWPEERGNTRSDSHAWSAHPTADLLGIVAGIQPDAPGYARVRIKPSLGTLTSLDAMAVTPKGAVHTVYRLSAGKLTVTIDCPPGLPGTFEWESKVVPLSAGRNRFVLPM